MRTGRRAAALAPLVALSLLATACGGGDDPAMETTATTADHEHGEGEAGHEDGHEDGKQAGAACEPGGTSVRVVAEDTAFDADCLAAPAGTPFTIAFENKDTFAHNIAILESHTATDVLFRGELFRGAGTTTYSVPALKAGNYAYHCEVHPAKMQGTFVVK